MTWVFMAVAALALIPAVNALVNMTRLHAPPVPSERSRVAILIPARNEARTIGACIEAALASRDADIEVIVLDDGSTDGTKLIVEERARGDSRLRIAASPPLPPGMKGKPHACHVLSQMTDCPFLLFVDADVLLSPTAVARLVPPPMTDLISGIPRQITHGVVESAVVPMINSLILGYLPIGLMREKPSESLAAACGQLIMVRATAYRAAGGHAAIATFMHDGMQLAKSFRRRGYRTDLTDATDLARCRMYDSAAAVFQGFAKNATEGMARPRALPLWTVLLAGGHLASLGLCVFILSSGTASIAGAILLCSTGLLIAARIAQAIKCREAWEAVLLHPLGVVLTLAIQWRALYCYLKGDPVTWRGRAYAPTI